MNNSYLIRLSKRLFIRFFQLKPHVYVFITTLLLYSALWLINPGNKIIALSFGVLLILLNLKFKNIRLSLLLTYLASLIILSGKMYLFELVSPNIYLETVFASGHVSALTISTSSILSIIMLIFLIRDYSLGSIAKLNFKIYEVALISFFIWKFLSDLIGSQRPDISLPYSFIALQPLIVYVYLKSYPKYFKNYLSLIISLVALQVCFEFFISSMQFINGSPYFKNIEFQESVSNFGNAIDEPKFSFRPAGTFIHANQLAIWLSFWLSILVTYLYKKRNIFVFTVFILGIVSLAMTLSRSGWLGFSLAGMFCLYVLEKIKNIQTPQVILKHNISLSVIAIILFVFLLLPRAEKSFYSINEGGGLFRKEQIREAMLIISQNPVFGVGSAYSVPAGLGLDPKGFFSQNPNVIHNYYATLTAEHGIPSLVLLVIFIIYFLRDNITKIWRQTFMYEGQYLRLGLVAGIISLLIIYLFQPYESSILLVLACGILESKYAKKFN